MERIPVDTRRCLVQKIAQDALREHGIEMFTHNTGEITVAQSFGLIELVDESASCPPTAEV